MYDTVKGGDYLTDQDAAEVLAKDAIRAVYELEHMGVPFNRTADGTIAQRAFGGHTKEFGEAPIKRACYAADRTGRVILDTLTGAAIRKGIKVYSEYHLLDLIKEGSRVSGLVAYELATGKLRVFTHGRFCWPLEDLAKSSKQLPTVLPIRGMGSTSRIVRVSHWKTWNSCSFTPQASTGSESSSVRQQGGRGGYFVMEKASGLWKHTRLS